MLWASTACYRDTFTFTFTLPYLTVNPRYNGLREPVSVIIDVCYNRVKLYSRKYVIAYTANTRNTHGMIM
jgi:hypothetical protein